MSDTNARSNSPEAVGNTEELFRQLADSIHGVLWISDSQGSHMVYASSGYEEVWGRSRESLYTSPRSWVELIHPDDRERVLKAAEDEENPGGFNQEYRILRADGAVRWIHDRTFPIRGPLGREYTIAGIAEDITERKRAEERLRLLSDLAQRINAQLDLGAVFECAVAQLATIFNAQRTAVITYALDDRSKTLSVAAENEIASHLDGANLPDLKREFPVAGTRFENVLSNGQPMYTPDLTPSNGSAQTLVGRGIHSDVLVPILVKEKPFGVLAVGREVAHAFTQDEIQFLARVGDHLGVAIMNARLYSQLETAYVGLQQTQQQVIQQERLRALGQMASGIAHDFNNALSPILGFSDLLLEVPSRLQDTDTVTRYLEMIRTAAEDAAGVVSRLREFYRQRQQGETLLPVLLNQVVQQVVALTQPKWKDEAQAHGKNFAIKTDLCDVGLIAGNPSELREMLTNLLFNAMDAMPEGGTITVRTCVGEPMNGGAPTHVVLQVIDTGFGMSDEVRLRCLEPFFSTKGDHGTGLGLAMVHGIVSRHDGTLDIKSEWGKGTTITIRLPVPRTYLASMEQTHAPMRYQPQRTLRVLVADDEPLVRELLADYLKADGHQVETAIDGHEGLRKFGAAKFDLVVTDRAMPGMNGDQLAGAIKKVAPNKPVIMLTGFGEFMQVTGDLPEGVDHLIAKPVTLTGLRQAVAKVMAE